MHERQAREAGEALPGETALRSAPLTFDVGDGLGSARSLKNDALRLKA